MKALPPGYTFARALNGHRHHIVKLGRGPYTREIRDPSGLPVLVEAWDAEALGCPRSVKRIRDPSRTCDPDALCGNCAAKWLGIGNTGSRDLVAAIREARPDMPDFLKASLQPCDGCGHPRIEHRTEDDHKTYLCQVCRKCIRIPTKTTDQIWDEAMEGFKP